jgi:putative ABC transport system permease protein
MKTQGPASIHLAEQLRRYWRLAEMRLLLLALLVSVTAVTSVTFFTERMDRAMMAQASQVLGGDLVLTSSRPLDRAYIEEANQLGLRHAELIEFGSMVLAGENLKLAQVRAVTENYPLIGSLETNTTLDGTGQKTRILPEPGQAWAESRLFIELDVEPGNEIQLGKRNFDLTHAVTRIPDQGTTSFQFAPQIFIPMSELDSTGLLTPASRARFRMIFTGTDADISDFRQWLKPRLQATEKIQSLDDGMPAIQQAMQRAQRFLGLASLLSVILAGAAIALASYSLGRREIPAVAVLKTLGAGRRYIVRRYTLVLMSIATLAAVFGAILGFLLQLLLSYLLRDFINQSLPAPGWTPLLIGLLTSWIMMLGFAAPQIYRTVNITPVQIFQGLGNQRNLLLPLSFAFIALSVFALMWVQARELRLALYLFFATTAAIAVFWFSARLLESVLRKLAEHQKLHFIRLQASNRRTTLLTIVFGTSFFCLLLLSTLHSELIDRWEASIPEDAPNQFLVNIQPGEKERLRQHLEQRQIKTSLYPMIRGRLVAINGQSISPSDYEDDRAQRLLAREFNLSALRELPASNEIIQGQWFADGDSEGFSIEEGIAQTLGISMGDQLTYDIAGQPFTETITSIRTVRWDSMQPNFFVATAGNRLNNQPSTFITSIHIPTDRPRLVPELIRAFPSVTAIDISSILRQVRDIIDRASLAVQFIFSFTLVAGFVVLLSALQSQQAERRREIAIIKSLGGNRAYLRKMIFIEFTTLGVLSGLLAGVFTLIVTNIIAYKLFELNPELNIGLVGIAMLLGGLFVGLAGYLNLRPLLNVTPVALFQEGSQNA